MQTTTRALMLVGVMAVTCQAWALELDVPLEFVAPDQSLWGPGTGPGDISESGRIGGSLGIRYDFGASAGTASPVCAG